MPFVLDNSVVTGWYIGEQANAYTDHIATRLETERAVVPALWQLELANVLKTACTKGKLPLATALDIANTLSGLPIDVDHDGPGPKTLLEIALRYELSSYDAAYLELAMRKGLPLATRDDKLRAAALAAYVPVLGEKEN